MKCNELPSDVFEEDVPRVKIKDSGKKSAANRKRSKARGRIPMKLPSEGEEPNLQNNNPVMSDESDDEILAVHRKIIARSHPACGDCSNSRWRRVRNG